jgi:hypothetical protein
MQINYKKNNNQTEMMNHQPFIGSNFGLLNMLDCYVKYWLYFDNLLLDDSI